MLTESDVINTLSFKKSLLDIQGYTQGVKKLIFHKQISKRIPIQISSNFDSMFLTGKNLMFNVFIFTGIEMPFTGREKAYCALEYAQSQSNKTVQHAFVRELTKQSPTVMQIWTWQKKSKRMGVCAGEKDLDDQKHQTRWLSVFVKNLAEPKETAMKNKSGNPYSTNNSLAHPEETIDNETLQATTRSGHNGRLQAKAQNELTCGFSGGTHIEHV